MRREGVYCHPLYTCIVPEGSSPTETNSSTRHTFAAYSESDYTKWRTTLEHVVSRSPPTSGGLWAESVISGTSLGQDSVFSASGDYGQRHILEVRERERKKRREDD